MSQHRSASAARATMALAAACGLATTALPAAGQSAAVAPAVDLGKVEVTGSHIRRAESEAALPVQVITREEIERSGVSTVAELMSRVSANIAGFNEQLSLGAQIDARNSPGLSSINLRGMGDGSTLVLVNGRRVANYAFDSGTVDVSSIPLSAVQRVEILKDGASAIYGTDALAGVVNFILRTDYRGIEASARALHTQHGHGGHHGASVLVGGGDLAVEHVNAFVIVDYLKSAALQAVDRAFSRTGYAPAAGLFSIGPQTFPANIVGPDGILSPALASGCAPPVSIVAAFGSTPACMYDFASGSTLVPASERVMAFGRVSWQPDPAVQLFIEASQSQNRLLLTFAPTPVFRGFLNNLERPIYPAGGPYYPSAFAAAKGLGDLELRYRLVPLGPRTNEVETRASRFVVGADGSAGGWDYRGALLHSSTRERDRYLGGWVSQQRLLSALATGLVNPFGPSAPEGDALLASTQVSGDFHHARGTTTLLDGKVSREIARLAHGPLSIALGAEARREKLEDTYAPIINSGDLVAAGGQRASISAGRSVEAVYAEALVPLARGVEAQVAARGDRYSDFDTTWNPKLALRWQADRALLLRGSWGKGFRAPTLVDLHAPTARTFTTSRDDPLRCPTTGAQEDCQREFPTTVGGNPAVQPERSEQFNLGAVWEPLPRLTLTLDAWKINKRRSIGTLDEQTLFNSIQYFPGNFVRGPADPDHPNLPGPIVTVLEQTQNIGNLRTAGVDVGLAWRGLSTAFGRFGLSLEGSYIARWRQQFDGITYVSVVGTNDFYAIPRWRHALALNWESGPWTATLGQTFQSSYLETVCDADDNCRRRRVGAAEFWDVQASYAGWRHLKVSAGIRNVFDRAPPFTTYLAGFQSGYDPTYADPRGRSFHVKVTVAFP